MKQVGIFKTGIYYAWNFDGQCIQNSQTKVENKVKLHEFEIFRLKKKKKIENDSLELLDAFQSVVIFLL